MRASAQWNVPQTPGSIVLRREAQMASGRSGGSTTGVIRLRQDQVGKLDTRTLEALRHEVAHQFLWLLCPAAANDRLFHEAFAVATSGELSAWQEGPYLSLAAASAQLESSASPDDRLARRAIARLLSEAPTDAGTLGGCSKPD